MKRLIAAIILAAPILCSPVVAEEGTAQSLYDRCLQNDPLCGSYLLGVGSVMSLLGKTYQDQTFEYKFVAPLSTFAICPNGAPANGHVLRHVFMAWFDRHPENKGDFMGTAALDAFREAWPCEKPN